MYWVRQNKGIHYRVNESHILSLKRSRREGGHAHGAVLDIPLADYIQRSGKFQSNYKGYKVAVEFAEQPLPIEPYFLGLWLGDGNSGDVRISSQDPEVAAYLAEYAQRLGLQLSRHEVPGKCPLYAITSGQRGGNQEENSSLQRRLGELGVLQNKRIPTALSRQQHRQPAATAGRPAG
jgi:replicative DNA helicase